MPSYSSVQQSESSRGCLYEVLGEGRVRTRSTTICRVRVGVWVDAFCPEIVLTDLNLQLDLKWRCLGGS